MPSSPSKQSQSSNSNRSSSGVNPRAIALSAISFFIGVQFTYLRDLFASGDALIDPDEGWAPDGSGIAEAASAAGNQGNSNNINSGIGRGMSRAEKRKQREKANEEEEENDGKKKKKKVKVKKPVRFAMTNYTMDFEPLPWSLPQPTPIRYQTSEEFMSDYIAAKRHHKIALPWEEEDKYASKPVSLPLPIISLNFPKSATLTLSFPRA